MSELPSSWRPAALSDICYRIVDGSHNPPKGVDSGRPMLSARNVINHQILFDEFRYISDKDFVAENARTQITAGDVLLTIVGTIGRSAVVPALAEPFALQRSVAVIKPIEIDGRYLAYVFDEPSQQQWLVDNAKGTAQKGVYLKTLGTAKIPIAPIAEQTRIVEKLEELLSDLDTGVAELKAAQRKLAQYRQSLLKAAVEGALTADWRDARHKSEKPPSPSSRRKLGSSALATSKSEPLDPGFRRDDGNSETGAALLQRILTERRARWEARQLAKFAEQGKIPPKDWKAKYPSPVAPDTTDLPALPDGWVWASLDQLVAESSYGTSVKCSYEGDGVPVLRIPNVASRTIDLSNLKFSTEPLKLESTDYLAEGDILFVRTNGSIGLVGRAAEVRSISDRNLYFASYLLRVRCTETDTVPGWISAFVASDFGRRWIERRAASSAGQHNISLSTLLTIHVPFPGLAEQRRALEALGVALEGAAEQESAVETALLQSAAQRKNILKAAFAGQLVPQDPNDEPASALLERIRAERVSGGAKRSGKTGRKLREQA